MPATRKVAGYAASDIFFSNCFELLFELWDDFRDP